MSFRVATADRPLALPLDPLTLRHFLAVCDAGSTARAAARQALVESARSERTAALEAGLGVSRPVPRRRGVELTSAGHGLAILPREAVSVHAGTGRVALVPLDETWAVRRFVVVGRAPQLQTAAARRLGDHLCRAPGTAPA